MLYPGTPHITPVMRKYIARGLARLGLTYKTAAIYATEFFTEEDWWRNPGDNVPTLDLTRPGGIYRSLQQVALLTPARAMPGSAEGAWGRLVTADGNAKCYFACRFSVGTLVKTGSAYRIGFGDSPTTTVWSMRLGFTLATPATFLFVASGPGVVLSSIPYDTNFHTGEMWKLGANAYGTIDGEPLVTLAGVTEPGAGVHLGPQMQLSSTSGSGAEQLCFAQWGVWIGGRAS